MITIGQLQQSQVLVSVQSVPATLSIPADALRSRPGKALLATFDLHSSPISTEHRTLTPSMAAASASASSTSASSAAKTHDFDAGDMELHLFLQTLSSLAEKETAMIARRWGDFPATVGLHGEGFELVRNDPGAPIQFRILWAASDPDLQPMFMTSCPKGIWISVSLPRACPYEAPTFSATCDELRGPIPPAALCKAVAKVCNDRAIKVCEDAIDADGSVKPKAWPVKSAFGMLDKGIGTILSVLGSRLGGKTAARPAPVARSSAAAATSAATEAVPKEAAASAASSDTAAGFSVDATVSHCQCMFSNALRWCHLVNATSSFKFEPLDFGRCAQTTSTSPMAPDATEQLLRHSAELDIVQVKMDEALATGNKLRLSGLSSECGVVMTALDSIDCGPRGSPARQLRREIIQRAETMGDAAERAATAL